MNLKKWELFFTKDNQDLMSIKSLNSEIQALLIGPSLGPSPEVDGAKI